MLWLILLTNVVLGAWDLGRAGWQNIYYAAGVFAGSSSWPAFFFVGLDPAGGATVDKPPLAFWVMESSVRLFGFHPWSMLLPQVLISALTCAVLFALVRRLAGDKAGLLAAAALTLTPVSVWMARGNYPDPLMVLLMTAAAYCTVRALPALSIRWIIGAGSMIGLAFLTKTMESVLIVPALVLVILLGARVGWARRCVAVLIAAGSAVLVGGWWFLLVDAIPAGRRPYVAGTSGNSVVELALGYNGAGRVGSFVVSWARAGRLFVDPMAGLISLLLPAGILSVPVLLILGLVRRSSKALVAGLLFGGWLLVGAVTLTFSTGIINSYYVLSIAPPIAGALGSAVVMLWRSPRGWASATLMLMLAITAGWGCFRLAPAGVGVAVAVTVLVAPACAVLVHRHRHAVIGRLGGALVTLILLLPTGLAAGAQLGTHHEAVSSLATRPGVAALLAADRSGDRFSAAVAGGRDAAFLELQSGRPVLDIGGFNRHGPLPTLRQLQSMALHGQIRYFVHHAEPLFGLFTLGSATATPALEIAQWVNRHFRLVYFAPGVQVFDLATPCSDSRSGPSTCGSVTRLTQPRFT